MDLWQKCVEFHGHECGGLTIGYKAALYAQSLLGLSFSSDEELVCIAENDACGIDAIQVILGCSVGKGNLLFHLTGKQAFSFYNRGTNTSIRLVLKAKPEDMTREETFAYYQNCAAEEMFDIKETKIKIPEQARIFASATCACCGESTAEHMLRVQNSQKVCRDCFAGYNRFDL